MSGRQLYDPRRLGKHSCAGRNIRHHHRIRADDRIVADFDSGKDHRAGAHFHSLSKFRTLVQRLLPAISRPDCGAVANQAVISNL